MSNEYPAMFLDSVTGRLPEKCDGCRRSIAPTSPMLITNVMTSIRPDGTRGKKHELCLCTMCWAEASAAITPQSRARLVPHVEDEIAKRMLKSADFDPDYLRTLTNREFRAGDTQKIREHMRVCRFCAEDTLDPRLGGEVDFIHTAVFQGGELVVKTGRYLRFEIPQTLCEKCDAAAASRLSDVQRDALDVVYARLEVEDHGFRPVLPFIAEHPLAV